ncbi:hypothetical protein J4443_05310 [Candidatus Woesearchaeota archaeon]|nr:hypothetical protein [Candidatus Woesearchaeota archaeon]
MIKAKELKVYIEDTQTFKEKIKKELKAIDVGRAKTLKEDSISFQSLSQFRKFLTPKRLELLRVVRHKKPKSIYELSKFVKRTPENVNTDIKFLEQLGFIGLTKVREIRPKVIPEVDYNKMTVEIPI